MSFRLKTILGVALIEAVFVSVLIFNFLQIMNQSHLKQAQEEAARFGVLFSAAATDALLSSDIATLNSMVAELLTSPHVTYVSIHDNSSVLSSGGVRPSPDDELGATLQEIPIKVGDAVFGNVELGLDASALDEAWLQARDQSIRIAIIGVVLVALVSMMFGSYLTRQLQLMRSALRRLQEGDFSLIEANPGRDELGETISAFNLMSRELESVHQDMRESLEQARALAHKLHFSEAQLRAITDNMLDGLITLNAEGKIRYMNHASETMFGYAMKELEGHRYDLIIVDQLQRDRIEGFILKLSHHRAPAHVTRQTDEWGYRRDGGRFPIDLIINAAEIDGDQVAILTFRDLSKIKELKEMADINLAVKEAMLECSLNAIVSVNDGGKIVEFNPAAEDMFGYSRDDVMFQPVANYLVPTALRGAFREQLDQFKATGRSPFLNKRLQGQAERRDGVNFPIEISITVSRLAGCYIFTAMLEDISERRQEQESLRNAIEEADRANHAKSDFLASMSHEIRTPLNVVLGTVELLKDTPLTRHQRHYLQSAESAGKNLLEIINDVLDLAKIEAGKLEPHLEPCNLPAKVEYVTRLLSQRAHQKGLFIQSVIDANTPASIVTDSSFLRQILVNLIGNAIKFTQRGGVNVMVYVAHLHGTQHLCIDVSDTGPGISAEAKKKIFSEFFQEHSHRDGTGLGLMISRHMANIINGDITLASKVGSGSTFSLQLPLANTAPPTVNRANLDALVAPLQGHRIIIASDSREWRRAFQWQLHLWTLDSVCCLQEEDLRKQLDSGLKLIALLDMENPPDWIDAAFQEPALTRIAVYRHASQPKTEAEGCYGVLHTPATRKQTLQALLACALGRPIEAPESAEEVELRRDNLYAPSSPQSVETDLGEILVVDDSDANLLIARSFLEYAGFHVDTALSGKEAIEKIESSAYDLIFMDMRMPGLSGRETVEVMRRRGLTTPIVALTAHAMTSERESCLAGGMQDFLTKPVDRARLIEMASHWIRKSGKKASPPAPLSGPASLFNPTPLSGPASTSTPPAAEPGVNNALINPKALEQLLNDTSADTLKRMLGIFSTELTKRVDAMQAHLGDQDYEQFEICAHALKSSSQTFGAQRIHLHAKAIEEACKAHNYTEAENEYLSMRQLTDSTLEALNELHPFN
ncbi:PAS domain S-box protein [Hahella sp. NBU794]|uniref:PAS domain S-box protein n=1 Tax=Hahella sp. NBU794 TaxID=3422590 RepID=UPI003D6E6EA8